MPSIAEVRQKYPQYQDLSDEQLADALHRKFYSDMPKEEFDAKIGLAVAPAAPQEPPVGTLDDVWRSGATGLREGVEGIAGTPGDIKQMVGSAVPRVAENVGAMLSAPDPRVAERLAPVGSLLSGIGEGLAAPFRGVGDAVSAVYEPVTKGKVGRLVKGVGKGMSAIANPLTTEQIRQGLTDPLVKAVGGEDVLAHEPKTIMGKYARTTGQFAPGVLIPGSAVSRVKNVVMPAVASETAGQLTEGTDYEQYARLAGGVVGGRAAAGRKPKAAAVAAAGAPTRQDLKAATDATYGQLRSANIRYDDKAFGKAVLGMASEFRKRGFRPSIAKEAYNVIEELAGEVGTGRAPDFDDINGLAQAVGGKARAAMRAGDNTLAEAYGIIRDHLDDFERVSPMTSGTGMKPEDVRRLHGQARNLALRNIKARTLEEIVANADTYAAGQEAGIRNGINNLLRSKKGIQLFKGDERKALLEVAQGRKALRTLSRFGFDLTRLAGNATALPTAGIIGASFGLGPVAGAGLAAAGTAAKLASPALTNRAFEQASAAIRSGRVNSRQVQSTVKAKQLERLIRTVVAGDLARGSALAHQRN